MGKISKIFSDDRGRKEVTTMKDIQLKVEELEERIAPSIAPGLQGYEGQPGNQGGQNGNNGPAPGLLGYEGQPGNQGG
jgi:hypothetical protein